MRDSIPAIIIGVALSAATIVTFAFSAQMILMG